MRSARLRTLALCCTLTMLQSTAKSCVSSSSSSLCLPPSRSAFHLCHHTYMQHSVVDGLVSTVILCGTLHSQTCWNGTHDALQDVMARYKETGHKNWKDFPSKACFQMNDTHPTIAVAELMRLLIDQEGLDWEEAWSITTQVNQIAAVSCCTCSFHLRIPILPLSKRLCCPCA